MAERIRPELAILLGQRIRAARASAGLTVTKLADLSALSRRMLTQIELGQANPSLGTLDRVASALGTTFAALVGASTRPSPDGVKVWSSLNGSWAYLLTATETPQVSVELWKWHLAAGDSYRATPPANSPDSLVHVLRGRLCIRHGPVDHKVEEGKSARISARSRYTLAAASDVVDFFSVATIPRNSQ